MLAALVALCCGGCGKAVSREGPALETPGPQPYAVSSDVAGEPEEGTVAICDEPSPDMGEAGVWGYADPSGNETMRAASVTEDGYTWGQTGGMGDGCPDKVTPWMANWGEDRLGVMNEESISQMNEGEESDEYVYRRYEETPCTPGTTEPEYTPAPAVDTEQEYAPGPTGDSEQKYTPEPGNDTEQEYTPEPAGDGDDSGCDVAGPYLDGENETPSDANSSNGTLEGFGLTTMSDMNWRWTSTMHMFLNSWRQAMITATDETGVSWCEAFLPAMAPEVGRSEPSDDPEPGSSP